MGDVRRLESPSIGKLMTAILAISISAILIVGMILFAAKTNEDPSLINWFGVVTALAGALAFECTKYAVTVKSRHLQDLSTRVMLTPAKLDELARVVNEVEMNRKLYSGLNSAIDFRSRELALEYEQAQLRTRALEAREALGDLEERQRRLAFDEQAEQTQELADEIKSVLERLGEPRGSRILDDFARSPNFAGLLGTIAAWLVQIVNGQMKRVVAKRKKEQIKRLGLANEFDETSTSVMQDDSRGA